MEPQPIVALDLNKTQDYFGKKQKIISTFFFIIFNVIFFGPVFLFIYAVITFDYQIILSLFLISILQLPVKKSDSYVRFMKKYCHPFKYFKNIQIIYDHGVPKNQKSIFGVHPHSVNSYGLMFCLNASETGPFSNLVGLSSRFALNLPLLGLALKLWGFQGVNSNNMRRLMKQGRNIGLIPGGFEQATITTSSQMRIWIKNKKGFIKYAIQNDYTIHPVIVLNEHQAFSTFDYFLKFRLLINKLKIPGTLFWSKYTGIMIPPIQIQVIVGKGIKVESKKDSNLFDLINETHKLYIQQIQRLYKKYESLNGNKPLKFY